MEEPTRNQLAVLRLLFHFMAYSKCVFGNYCQKSASFARIIMSALCRIHRTSPSTSTANVS